MNTNIHQWRILKIKIEIRVHSCSFVAKMERLKQHTEIAIIHKILSILSSFIVSGIAHRDITIPLQTRP